MSSTIGDRMADFHWVTGDGEQATAVTDAADPQAPAEGPQPAEAAAEEGIAAWAKGIDWGAVKRETQIMLKLNPNFRMPDPEEGDQAAEAAPEDEPEA